MSKNRNALSLDSDYYSAGAYEEIEKEQPVYRQLFMVLMLIVVSIFSYNYFINTYFSTNNSSTISSEVMEVEPIAVAKEKKPFFLIREEAQPIVVSVKDKMLQDDTLSDEYIKLVQESLGNY
ncbi:MAG: Unknown protein [uncultured Sulfurovum sp.]|uniref:Uncharacterized protein n=1 Tax=uncultured Sulfurovum sp. TaxID=269237 RepID=A0A6S6SB71_9BACT|nr:MAG: Unknown protein [uncultured Sulfurovum sp.]